MVESPGLPVKGDSGTSLDDATSIVNVKGLSRDQAGGVMRQDTVATRRHRHCHPNSLWRYPGLTTVVLEILHPKPSQPLAAAVAARHQAGLASCRHSDRDGSGLGIAAISVRA
jgi:hypothetical protein